MLLLGAAESTPKGIPRQGHVAIAAPARETHDAQLFAQKRSMLQGQTDQRSQLLHCQTDLTARHCHDPSFSWDFAGRRPIQTGPRKTMACPTKGTESSQRSKKV